jgi:selenoprotein W-related protein
MPQAASLAAAIKKSIGVDAELIPGSGGVFDVKADGQLVFSKKIAGRFPEPDEVLGALKG